MLFRLDVVGPDVKSWVLAVEGTVTPLSQSLKWTMSIGHMELNLKDKT